MYCINKWINTIMGKYVFFVVCRLVLKKVLPKENFATIFVVKNSYRTKKSILFTKLVRNLYI